MTKTTEATWYADYFARPIWVADMAGAKPSLESLKVAHAFGKPGKQSLALAMAMRATGVTGSEIQIACGAPQNNHRRGLITEGLFKRIPHPSRGNVTVYKIELSDKGRKAMATAAAKAEPVEAKPAKAAKPEKAKPAKVKAVKKAKAKKAAPAPEPGKPAADGSVLIKAKPEAVPVAPVTPTPEAVN